MNGKPQLNEKPFWNRPLFGNISLWQRILGILHRQQIPDSVLSFFDRELESLNKIEPTLRMLDNGQYSDEFLFYMEIKQKIAQNLGEYTGLEHFIHIISFTIKNIKDLQVLSRVELDFQGKTQIQLYKFIEEQLNSNSPSKLIRKTIRNQLQKSIENTRNQPTKEALMSYKQALESIINRKSGVELLASLKQHNITNYSIFDIFYTLIKETKDQDIQNLKFIVLMVKNKKKELDKLFTSISFPKYENSSIVYAQIIQYLALSFRYEHITFRFEQFLEMLNKWFQHYQEIINIKEQYPSSKYHLPYNFSAKIPGLSIYLKYKIFLLEQ
jgi:L-rhamnose mutarotase